MSTAHRSFQLSNQPDFANQNPNQNQDVVFQPPLDSSILPSLTKDQNLLTTVDTNLEKEKQLKVGFLKCAKSGKSNNWKKIWCVLRVNALALYKCNKEYKILQLIKTSDITHVEILPEDGSSCSFRVLAVDKTFNFKSSNQAARDLWVESLHKAINTMAKLDFLEPGSLHDRKSTFSIDPISLNFAQTKKPLILNNQPITITEQSLIPPTPSNINHSFEKNLALQHCNIENSSELDETSGSPEDKTDANFLKAAFGTGNDLSKPSTSRAPTLPKNRNGCPGAKLKRSPSSDGFTRDLHSSKIDVVARLSLGSYAYADIKDYDKCVGSYSPRLQRIQLQLANETEIKSGYLFKRCRLNRWYARWFVLRSNSLTYYKNNKEYKVSQLLTPDDIIDVRLQDKINGKSSLNSKLYIKLTTHKRTYWLVHEDNSSAKDWVQAIKNWKLNMP